MCRDLEIREDVGISRYKCNDCEYEFRGIIMKNIRCPVCHSSNTIKR